MADTQKQDARLKETGYKRPQMITFMRTGKVILKEADTEKAKIVVCQQVQGVLHVVQMSITERDRIGGLSL